MKIATPSPSGSNLAGSYVEPRKGRLFFSTAARPRLARDERPGTGGEQETIVRVLQTLLSSQMSDESRRQLQKDVYAACMRACEAEAPGAEDDDLRDEVNSNLTEMERGDRPTPKGSGLTSGVRGANDEPLDFRGRPIPGSKLAGDSRPGKRRREATPSAADAASFAEHFPDAARIGTGAVSVSPGFAFDSGKGGKEDSLFALIPDAQRVKPN